MRTAGPFARVAFAGEAAVVARQHGVAYERSLAAIRQVLSTGIATTPFPAPAAPPFAPAAFTGEVRLGAPGVATCRLNLAAIRRALSMRPEVRCVSRSRAECSADMTGSGMNQSVPTSPDSPPGIQSFGGPPQK